MDDAPAFSERTQEASLQQGDQVSVRDSIPFLIEKALYHFRKDSVSAGDLYWALPLFVLIFVYALLNFST